MRQSALFAKTRREVPKDVVNKSTEYLVRGAFIRESVAGRYYMLPLGMRVQDKVTKIVEEEMAHAGAQKMITPTLHPLELWKETNRTSSAGFELMQVTDRHGASFALGGTAEEMFVDLVRSFQMSYKDLPFNLYQFSQKFRDELRARGGLLRVREFLMKDAYSFHSDEADFRREYENMWQTYTRIFKRLGLDTVVVEADNGYIGGEYCHEFIVVSPVGESTFFITDDGSYAAHEDVAVFHLDPVNPDEPLEEFEIIAQPNWVQTMEDNEKHYKKDRRFFLKNVVYKNREGDIIIVTIRGDLDVNTVKLKHVLNEVADLEEATAEDLAAIGTKTGYVHAWGHTFVTPRKTKTGDRECRVIYVADTSLKTVRNFIGGQKEESTDSHHVNYGRDFQHEVEGDVALAREGFLSKGGKALRAERGIEVGNIFQLGEHYSSRMKAGYINEAGEEKFYYMGCYGIGIGRTIATIVEKYNDEQGIRWPMCVAPFHVHLISLCQKQEEREVVETIYTQLTQAGVDVLYDERDLRAGEKFADSDLIGIPLRVVVSPKTLAQAQVELKRRDQKDPERISIDTLVSSMRTYCNIQ